jgi:hypothetical protein
MSLICLGEISCLAMYQKVHIMAEVVAGYRVVQVYIDMSPEAVTGQSGIQGQSFPPSSHKDSMHMHFVNVYI